MSHVSALKKGKGLVVNERPTEKLDLQRLI